MRIGALARTCCQVSDPASDGDQASDICGAVQPAAGGPGSLSAPRARSTCRQRGCATCCGSTRSGTGHGHGRGPLPTGGHTAGSPRRASAGTSSNDPGGLHGRDRPVGSGGGGLTARDSATGGSPSTAWGPRRHLGRACGHCGARPLRPNTKPVRDRPQARQNLLDLLRLDPAAPWSGIKSLGTRATCPRLARLDMQHRC